MPPTLLPSMPMGMRTTRTTPTSPTSPRTPPAPCSPPAWPFPSKITLKKTGVWFVGTVPFFLPTWGGVAL